MKSKLSQFSVDKALIWVAISLGSVFQFSKFQTGLTENHSFRQSQTAWVVRKFMSDGVDIRTPLPVFGEQNQFVPFEFPIFQVIASFVGRSFSTDAESATRITSVIFFQFAGYLAICLLRIRGDQKVVLPFVLLYQFTPFGIIFGHSALIEWLPVTLIMLSVLATYQVNVTNTLKLKFFFSVLVAILLVSAFLSKVTTALVLMPLFLFLPTATKSIRALISLLIPVFSALPLIFLAILQWTLFSDRIKNEGAFTSFLTSESLSRWNFGTFRQRFALQTWDVILIQNLSSITGGIGITIVIVFVLWRSRKFFDLLGPILSIIVALIIFTNLYKSHDYYLIAIYIPITTLLAFGVVLIVDFLKVNWGQTKKVVVVSLIVIVSAISTKYGHAYIAHSFFINHKEPELSSYIKKVLVGDEQIVLIDCDWDPTISYYANRELTMIPNWPIKKIASVLPNAGTLVSCKFPSFVDINHAQGFLGPEFTVSRISNAVFEFSREN